MEKDKQKLNRLNQTIDINIDVLSIMTLIATVQFATRNQNWNGESRNLAVTVARNLQGIINDVVPEYSAIMEMGWNPDFDIE